MKKIFYIIIALCCISNIEILAQGKTYFISPSGDDSNSGLSIHNPWKTIQKVNQYTFQPGDAILFETGSEWKGQLEPQGSGKKGSPIRIGSYGKADKPVINLGDARGPAIKLINQPWWEIENLEITSGVQPERGIDRQGIVALVEDEDNIQHIVVRNCYIHDIWGQLGHDEGFTGYRSCAILVGSLGRSEGNYNDVLIENNTIKRVDKCAIVVRGKNDIVVRKNMMENIGGDGIIVGGAFKGLIEHNIANRTCLRTGDPDLKDAEDWWPHTAAIWIIRCTETVMQYNEVYNTGRQLRNGDGFAYDFDFECKRCTLQYNYSANGHGLMLIMNRTYNNVIRYNISHNDQTHLIQIHGNIEDGNLIHNNLFYVDHSTVNIDYYCGMEGEADKKKLGATFKNNIFYANDQGRFQTVYTQGPAWDRDYNDSLKLSKPFTHNCYFGEWLNGLPDDPEKVVADPMFVAPGTGGVGLSSLKGYMLKRKSPCINAGASVSENSKKDFFGNPINDGTPDIGVYEQIGSKKAE